MMTIERLEKYYGIKQEITAIESTIKSLYEPISSPNGKEMGGLSTPSNPTERSVFKIEELRKKMIINDAECKAVEDWVENVDEPEIRAIIRFKYFCRLTWKDVCFRMYGYSDPDYCRKKIHRYFGKMTDLSD